MRVWYRILLWSSLGCAWPVDAEVYKWLDDEGHVHFGDCPPSGQPVSPVDIAPGPTPEQVRQAQERTKRLQEQLRDLQSGPDRIRAPTRAPGSTGACPALQRDVLRMLWLVDRARDRDCASRQILDTSLVEVVGGASPKVVERWTIRRCGERVDYLIEFTSDSQGGTYFTIRSEP